MRFFTLLLSVLFCCESFAALLPDPLLDAMDIPRDLTDSALLETVQREWFQGAAGRERWDFDNRFENKREELTPIFQEMGYLDEIPPLFDQYDYVLVIGATIWRVQKRIEYLENLIATGLTPRQIVFLTGMRPLKTDEKELCPAGIETESQMVEYVVAQSNLPRDIPIVFANAPMKMSREGILLRPQMIDTIGEWMKTSPIPGTCLMISSQPYIAYQSIVARKLIPTEFFVDSAGEKVSRWTVALVLDSIARALFEEQRPQ